MGNGDCRVLGNGGADPCGGLMPTGTQDFFLMIIAARHCRRRRRRY